MNAGQATTMIDPELDKQHLPSLWSNRSPDRPTVLKTFVDTIQEESARARKIIPHELNVPYGKSQGEAFDLFIPDFLPNDCSLVVFIHGGSWQIGSRGQYQHIAIPLVEAGIGTIIMGYDLTPRVKLDDIVEQTKKAFEWGLRLAIQRGSKAVYLFGYSAGAQLAAMMLHINWDDVVPASQRLFKGVIFHAGLFALTPMIHTSENINLKMTREDAVRNSPVEYVDKIRKPIDINLFIGEHDPPGYRHMTDLYYQALCSHGFKPRKITLYGMDHFEPMEKFADPNSQITKEVLKILGQA